MQRKNQNSLSRVTTRLKILQKGEGLIPGLPVDVHHGEPGVGAEGVRPHREDRAVRGPQPGHLQTGIRDHQEKWVNSVEGAGGREQTSSDLVQCWNYIVEKVMIVSFRE